MPAAPAPVNRRPLERVATWILREELERRSCVVVETQQLLDPEFGDELRTAPDNLRELAAWLRLRSPEALLKVAAAAIVQAAQAELDDTGEISLYGLCACVCVLRDAGRELAGDPSTNPWIPERSNHSGVPDVSGRNHWLLGRIKRLAVGESRKARELCDPTDQPRLRQIVNAHPDYEWVPGRARSQPALVRRLR